MLLADKWQDYEVLDTGWGEKVERWGKYILIRPDPRIIWPRAADEDLWRSADARFIRSSSGGGGWEYNKKLPESWTVQYNKLKFKVRPTGFKHTGLFPEQAANWDWIISKIEKTVHESGIKPSVLNLFAYTGGATAAAAFAGAEVCHVDAAKGMVRWAAENLELSGLGECPVRYLTDDVFKFVKREKRRGRMYDAIIMDPPSYGRGPDGEVWKAEDNLCSFMYECMDILKPKPLFFLLNSYTTGFTPAGVENLLEMTIGKKAEGKISCGEIGLPVRSSGLTLPCGVYARFE